MKNTIILFFLLILFAYSSVTSLALANTPYANGLPIADDQFEVLIASTHNLDGQIEAITNPNGTTQGGLQLLNKYLKLLKEKYGEKLLLVHTGSLFNSESTDAEKTLIAKWMQAMQYQAILISEQELTSNSELIKEYKLPIVTTNVIDLESGKKLYNESLTTEVNNRKIGIIGIYSYPRLKEKYLNPSLKGLYFKDEVSSSIEAKRSLEKYKPHFTVTLGSFNELCETKDTAKILKWGQGPKCEKKSDIYYFMRKTPKNLLDVIVNANGPHAAGYLKNTLIAQAPSKARAISLTAISYYDKNDIFDIKKSFGLPLLKTCNSFARTGQECNLSENLPLLEKMKRFFQESFSNKPATNKDANFLGKNLKSI